MFSLLVRRDGMIEPPSMSEIDSHCHILPGLDDGAPDEGVSIAIAHLLMALGVRTVIATPHVMSDLYPNTTEQIMEAVANTRRLFGQANIPLQVEAGAEYYIEMDLLDRIETGDVIAWGEQKNVMFEAPLSQKPVLLEDVVFSLTSAGYTPVLAHAERYRFLQESFDAVKRLKRMGLHYQVNHSSFHLPKTSRRGEMARFLYIKGMVDLLGTDIHRVTSDEQALASRGDYRLLFERLNSR